METVGFLYFHISFSFDFYFINHGRARNGAALSDV